MEPITALIAVGLLASSASPCSGLNNLNVSDTLHDKRGSYVSGSIAFTGKAECDLMLAEQEQEMRIDLEEHESEMLNDEVERRKTEIEIKETEADLVKRTAETNKINAEARDRQADAMDQRLRNFQRILQICKDNESLPICLELDEMSLKLDLE